MSANDKQVGGEHYNKDGEQHWDRMWRLYGRGYFIGCITKYVERYHLKNGIQDLEKAMHFLEKLIELEKATVISQQVGIPYEAELKFDHETRKVRGVLPPLEFDARGAGEPDKRYTNQD